VALAVELDESAVVAVSVELEVPVEVSPDELVEVSLDATDFEVVSLVPAGAGSEVVTDCSALVVDWLVEDVGGSVGVGSAAVVVDV
jgi:ribose 5-phosphate isomerase